MKTTVLQVNRSSSSGSMGFNITAKMLHTGGSGDKCSCIVRGLSFLAESVVFERPL